MIGIKINKYPRIIIFFGVITLGRFSYAMDLIEQYQREKLRLIPCKQCQPAEPFFEKLNPISDNYLKLILAFSPPELASALYSGPRVDFCKMTTVKHADIKGAIITTHAIAEAFGSECILLKAQLLQMPYQASAYCNLEDLLKPYIREKRKCALIVDKAEELTDASADALRSFIRTTRYQKFLSFIFLTLKGRYYIPEPLQYVLDFCKCVKIDKK